MGIASGGLAVAGGDEAGDPEEGALGFGVGEVGDGEAGGFGVGAGRVHGVVEGAVALQDLDDLGVGDAVEAAVGEDGADGFAVGAGAALEGVNDGQGGFAFAEVAGDGFAEDFFGGGEVEDVVDDLEGEAEVAAVFAELRFDLFACFGDGGPKLHGDLEEAGGLAEDEVEVLFFVDEVAELFDLEELAFDHLLGERDEEFEDAEVAFFEGGGEGLHV